MKDIMQDIDYVIAIDPKKYISMPDFQIPDFSGKSARQLRREKERKKKKKNLPLNHSK